MRSSQMFFVFLLPSLRPSNTFGRAHKNFRDEWRRWSNPTQPPSHLRPLPHPFFFYSSRVVSLEASKLFKQLTKEGLQAARASAREKTFQAGQEIFKEGDAGDGLYILKDGSVEISSAVNGSSRRVFSKISAGDMFGEMAVLEDKPRSASALAVKPTSAYFITRQAMLQLMESYPELSLLLLREISNRLREFNRQYLEETLQSERLAIVGRFARSIVHDLKNPLNVIGLTAELACLPEVTQEMREQSRARISKQIERISDMIGEILDFTQGSQSAFVLAPIDYATFIEQVANEIRPEAALKSADVELVPPLPSANPSRS